MSAPLSQCRKCAATQTISSILKSYIDQSDTDEEKVISNDEV